MSQKVVIVGGHGKVALLLAKRLAATGSYVVTSVIRNPEHSEDITALGASPLVLQLDSDPASRFAAAFEGASLVYFTVGAAYGDSEERFRKADYEGAVKVCDAIEVVKGAKPRLILVSGIDLRDEDKVPAHYTEADLALSKYMREEAPHWFKWKLEGDKELVRRTAFKWTILRPGFLTDEKGTGKADIGKVHLKEAISREDIAEVLTLLLEREDAAGLAIDVVGGNVPIAEGLDRFIKKGETDFALP